MLFGLILFDCRIFISVRKYDMLTHTNHNLKIGYLWRGVYRALWEWGVKPAYAVD